MSEPLSPAALALYAIAKRDLRSMQAKKRAWMIHGSLGFGAIVACALFLALILGGCAPATAPDEAPAPQNDARTTEALAVILTIYGEPAGAQGSSVAWVAGSPETICGETAMWYPHATGNCVRGLYDTAHPNTVTVVMWQGADDAQTSLAHETLHWLLHRQGHDGIGHSGDFYARVEAANQALWLHAGK